MGAGPGELSLTSAETWQDRRQSYSHSLGIAQSRQGLGIQGKRELVSCLKGSRGKGRDGSGKEVKFIHQGLYAAAWMTFSLDLFHLSV